MWRCVFGPRSLGEACGHHPSQFLQFWCQHIADASLGHVGGLVVMVTSRSIGKGHCDVIATSLPVHVCLVTWPLAIKDKAACLGGGLFHSFGAPGPCASRHTLEALGASRGWSLLPLLLLLLLDLLRQCTWFLSPGWGPCFLVGFPGAGEVCHSSLSSWLDFVSGG